MSGEGDGVTAARGASYLWVQNLVSSVVRVVAFAFFARLISVEEMGVFTIVTLAYSAASSFMGLGLSSVVTKFVAESAAKGDRVQAASVYYKALLLSELASVAIALGFLAWRFPVGVSGLPNSRVVVVIGVLFAVDVVANLGPTAAAAFFGMLEFRAYAMIYGLYASLRPWLVVLLIYELRSLVGLVGAWVISDAVLAVCVFLYLWRRIGSPVFQFSTKRLLRLSAPLYLASIAAFFYGTFDQLTLIPLVPLVEFGVYGAVVTAYGAYSGFISVLGSVLLPVFSGVRGAKGADALKDSVKAASRYAAFVAIPLAFALLATSRPALTLLVGLRYRGGAVPLAVLALSSVASIIALALSPVLIVLDETLLAALTSLIPLPISVGVALVSIPVVGIFGAALARGLSMVLGLLLTWYFVRRKLAVSLDYAAVLKSIVAGVAMAVVVWGIQMFYYNRFLLPVYVVVGFVVYLLAMRLLRAMNNDDIDFLRRTLGRRFVRLCDFLSWLTVS